MNLLRTTAAGARDWDLDAQESADLAESSVRLTGPVMVVDDEPMVRKSLANAIERIGARVVTAADGEEALRKFRELHNPLIFTDVRMPKLDGFGLLRSVKSLVPHTSVALITGFGSQELVDQAVHDGEPAGLDDVVVAEREHHLRLVRRRHGRAEQERYGEQPGQDPVPGLRAGPASG